MMINCYDRMVAIIKKMLSNDEKLVRSFYASKKMVKGLGIGYEKIDVCRYNYMLFYEEDELKTEEGDGPKTPEPLQGEWGPREDREATPRRSEDLAGRTR